MEVVVFLVIGFVALSIVSVLFKSIGVVITLFAAMLAGMFAGRLLRGRGYGPIGDIVLGLVGGLVGSIVLGILGINLGGIIGSVIVAVVGAVILVYAVRLFADSRFAS